jgi:glycosyltransferase involved in cell wall biosynthesis
VIRVGFICDTFELGGQELGCLALLRRLDRNRFTPYLYTFRPGNLLDEVAALGIPILVGHNKPPSDESWTATDAAARRAYRERLAAALHDDRIDVCMVYAWREGVDAAHAAGITAIIERVDGIDLGSRIADKSPCARVICEAKAVRDVILAQSSILNCRREQLRVIRNGIDLERFDPSRYDREQCRAALGFGAREFVIGALSRLAPEKNLEHLLRGVAALIHRYDKLDGLVRAVIAGPDCGSLKSLEAEAAQLGIAERVKFLPATSEAPQLLRALDVFAITSLFEGVPFALLEAMAMELPIVATPVGAIPETIDGNGFLVSVQRTEDMVQALRRLRSDVQLRHALAARSLVLSKRYDVNRMVREYEALMLDVVRERPAQAPSHAEGAP